MLPKYGSEDGKLTRMPLVLVLFVIICFACTSQVWAVPTVDVDGRRLETVVQPLIQNGRVFVPARSIIEAVGLSVHWDSTLRRVEFKRQDLSVELEVGAHSMLINGQKHLLDEPAIIVNDHVYVPLRLVAETFGYKVGWEAGLQKVSIFTGSLTATALPAKRPVSHADFTVLGDARSHTVEVIYTIWNQSASRISDLRVYTPFYLGVRAHYDQDPRQKTVMQSETDPALTEKPGLTPSSLTDNDDVSFDPGLKIRRMDAPSLSGGEKVVIKDRLDLTSHDIRFNLNPEIVIPYDLGSSTFEKYTRPEPAIESDHVRIRSKAYEIIRDLTNPLDRARAVYDFVVQHLEYRINNDNYGALYALDQRYVDCGEYAALFVALCRAAGIPARVVAGLSESEGKWENHGWAEFYLEGYGWAPVDPTWGDTAGEDYFGRLDQTHIGLLYGFTMIKASYEYSGLTPQISLQNSISRLN